jgi:hypothetical protein
MKAPSSTTATPCRSLSLLCFGNEAAHKNVWANFLNFSSFVVPLASVLKVAQVTSAPLEGGRALEMYKSWNWRRASDVPTIEKRSTGEDQQRRKRKTPTSQCSERTEVATRRTERSVQEAKLKSVK